jgi:hypothetical protein
VEQDLSKVSDEDNSKVKRQSKVKSKLKSKLKSKVKRIGELDFS